MNVKYCDIYIIQWFLKFRKLNWKRSVKDSVLLNETDDIKKSLMEIVCWKM